MAEAGEAMSAVRETRLRIRLGQSIDYRAELSDCGQQILRDAPTAEHAKVSTDASADPKPWQWELSDVGLKLIATATEKVPDRAKAVLDRMVRDGVRRTMSSFQREVDASEQVIPSPPSHCAATWLSTLYVTLVARVACLSRVR